MGRREKCRRGQEDRKYVLVEKPYGRSEIKNERPCG